MSTPRVVLFGVIVLLVLSPAWIFLDRPNGAASPPAAARTKEPLPEAAAGLTVRPVAHFTAGDQEPVRIAAHPATGRLYVLGGGGDVALLDLAAGTHRRVLKGADYIEQPKRQQVNIPLPIDAKLINSPITLRATLCLGMSSLSRQILDSVPVTSK